MKWIAIFLLCVACMPSHKIQMSAQERAARVKAVRQDRLYMVGFVVGTFVICWGMYELTHEQMRHP